MQIPPDALPPDVLARVIEEYVTREGTDYGPTECTTEQKVQQVKQLLQRGKAVLVFDPETESCNIVTPDQLP